MTNRTGPYGTDLGESLAAGRQHLASAVENGKEDLLDTANVARHLGPTAAVVGGLAVAATQEAGRVNLASAAEFNGLSIPLLLGIGAAALARRLPERGWTRRLTSTAVTAAGAGLGLLLGDPITGAMSTYAGYAMQRRISDKPKRR